MSKVKIEDLVPKNTVYCYDDKGTCPFWNSMFVLHEGHLCKTQYCSYLKQELNIPDQVKDCGISDDWSDTDE